MKAGFWVLTAVLFIGGFAFPGLWMAAIFTAIIAIGSAPPGLREDGKPRSGGLLGGVWDSVVVNSKMKTCPHCAEQILKEAKVCKHCGRDL